MNPDQPAPYGVVAIGRNEGDRLKKCLASAAQPAVMIYVDSGSTDDSVTWAKQTGADVVLLDPGQPFTAARARNAGFRRMRELAPRLDYVQFVDGDCELATTWPRHALTFLADHGDVCTVFGRLRERYPEKSIYNRLCDDEWNVPVGEANACGGIAMMRAAALEQAGGFRDDLIAGEEPELCVRLRQAGWRIWRLDSEMGFHDADMTHFSQWWRRNVRSGYAFAQGAHLHGALPERYYVWESRRALVWGFGLPILCLAACGLFGWWGLAVLLVYPLQILRRMRSTTGDSRWRAQRAWFELLSKFPEALGQLKFARDRWLRRQGRLIEYK
jgi:GT2 family glycosyltransferase